LDVVVGIFFVIFLTEAAAHAATKRPFVVVVGFLDNTYWKIGEPTPGEMDVDALLAVIEA
jgi:hypothetical protein